MSIDEAYRCLKKHLGFGDLWIKINDVDHREIVEVIWEPERGYQIRGAPLDVRNMFGITDDTPYSQFLRGYAVGIRERFRKEKENG
ncbi:hypothetical protein LCGC14_0392050 [marine sediment metagenome]|uniref:Uncharacterized protein n=1 Tax=marine sediment metagenome TaxID=412755 RepID=A0A0F9VLC2_9ZZZZ